MLSYQMHIPGEQTRETDAEIGDGGTDLLIKNLLESELTGYMRIQADPYLGFATFRQGTLLDGYLLKEGKVVSYAVNALIDFRLLCEKNGKVYIVELTEQYLSMAMAVHLGNVIITPTPVNIVNFDAIFNNYKDKISNGLLLLNGPDKEIGVIRIKEHNWKLNISRVLFDELMEKEGSFLALYEFDERSFKESLPKEMPVEKENININDLLKREIIRELREAYGDQIEGLVEKISIDDNIEDHVNEKLEEIKEYIEFFVESKGASEFAKKLSQVIRKTREGV